ncbi:MAG: hypothetical protein U9R72_17005 [Chloroflexota bacterium]|nr:hypothetical protein [Chloroflexota bacterium]
MDTGAEDAAEAPTLLRDDGGVVVDDEGRRASDPVGDDPILRRNLAPFGEEPGPASEGAKAEAIQEVVRLLGAADVVQLVEQLCCDERGGDQGCYHGEHGSEGREGEGEGGFQGRRFKWEAVGCGSDQAYPDRGGKTDEGGHEQDDSERQDGALQMTSVSFH